MLKILRKPLRSILKRPSMVIAGYHPSPSFISILKRAHQIQLSTEQISSIVTALRNKNHCRLLVFGLGYDSEFWARVNHGGTTVFLEDNADWHRTVTSHSRRITAYLVSYHTQRKDWKKLLTTPESLTIDLPEPVTETTWDVILVDGPMGYADHTPGRMSSIYHASRLVNVPGDVFVHDCNREAEAYYSDHFLKAENLLREIDDTNGLLRHYHLTVPMD